MPDVTVRPATAGDVPAMAAIHVAGYEDAYRGKVPDAIIDTRDDEMRRRAWGERLSAPGEREFVLVAELDGRVAGFVSGRAARAPESGDPEGRSGYWENLYLDPSVIGSAPGLRIGLALHEGVLRNLREHDFQDAVCFVADGNDRAQRFFESLGWRPDGADREVEGMLQRWDSLTAAEWRVAELAASGRSNPQIADDLFISRETVKSHLSRVFAKLTVINRAELAAAWARRT